MRKRKKTKSAPGPLSDLDMNAPFPVLTEEQKKAMVEEVEKKIAASLKKYGLDKRPRCMNGRGCPMCWGR